MIAVDVPTLITIINTTLNNPLTAIVVTLVMIAAIIIHQSLYHSKRTRESERNDQLDNIRTTLALIEKNIADLQDSVKEINKSMAELKSNCSKDDRLLPLLTSIDVNCKSLTDKISFIVNLLCEILKIKSL